MKERPILFSGPMVRAILAGRKTQTRRVVDKMRVHIPRRVRADWPGYGDAEPGDYEAKMNPLGAVSCRLKNGNWLGLKPGEFQWLSRFCEGTTDLVGDRWTITPTGPQRLWVKETFALFADPKVVFMADCMNAQGVEDGDSKRCRLDYGVKWKPSIFMPHKLSRITLEIVSVRVERLQDISHRDALAEGVSYDVSKPDGAPVPRYRALWDSINAKTHPWASNPWVWVITFKTI